MRFLKFGLCVLVVITVVGIGVQRKESQESAVATHFRPAEEPEVKFMAQYERVGTTTGVSSSNANDNLPPAFYRTITPACCDPMP